MKLQFVNISSHEAGRSGGRPGYTNDDERRRRIRTHVMRDFRRKERLFNTQLNKQASQKSGDRGQAIQYAESAARVPPPVNCPQIWRSSFAHVLVDGWFPTDIGYAPLLKNNIAYTYTAHDSAAVVAIHDAVLILHVGSISGNEGLLLEARKRYVAAVGGLRVNTSQVRPTTPLGTILLVAMGVLMSETYSPIATISVPIDWQKHIVGISALVSTYSKRCQNSPLEDYLLQQIWATQLIYALVTRKPFHDTLAIARIPSSSSRVNKLLDLASSIPRILQDADANSNLGPCEAKEALEKRLFDQRDALSEWLNAFRASNGHDGLTLSKPDREVGSSTHPRNARSLLCELTCETLCCICLLLLTESIHDLESSYILSDTDLTRHAGYLMNATSSLAKAAIVPICAARAISGPLFFLKRVYARIGDLDGLHWCEEMQRQACGQAAFLHWDALLPWSLITLYGIPHYDVRAGLE